MYSYETLYTENDTATLADSDSYRRGHMPAQVRSLLLLSPTICCLL